MDFRFDNYARHVGSKAGHDWYEWKVFMDESPERLNRVQAVEYRLHESFSQPIRLIETRDSRFALDATGWGAFFIPITVHLADGTEEYGEYVLDLSKGWPAES